MAAAGRKFRNTFVSWSRRIGSSCKTNGIVGTATSTPLPARTKMDKRRYVLLEPGKSRLGTFARLDAWVCRNTKDIAEVAARASKSSVWISFGPKADDDFLKAVVGKSMIPGRLLTLKPPRMDRIPLLSGFFLGMIGIGPAFRFLPDEELVEVLHL